jgi:hypothetical protein
MKISDRNVMYMEFVSEHNHVEDSARLYSLTDIGRYLPVDKTVRRILYYKWDR